MTVITDTAVRRRLSALHAAHAGKADLLAVARAKLADLTTRKSQLEQRQASEERLKLPADSVDDNALAAALLDDPSAAIEGEALTRASEAVASAAAARGAQQARIAVIRSALLKLQPLIVEASRQIETLESEESDAAQELRRAAHGALLDEFRSRFQALTAEVLDPLLVLQDEMKGAFSRLDRSNRVVIENYYRHTDEAGNYLSSETNTEYLLLDHPTHHEARRLRGDTVLKAFLAGLASKR